MQHVDQYFRDLPCILHMITSKIKLHCTIKGIQQADEWNKTEATIIKKMNKIIVLRNYAQ